MISFGPFRLDTANQRLYRDSEETQLTPKASAILEYLIRRQDELVTHNELLDIVWHGVHVQPEVLKVYIAELRRALGDSADKPRYIKTVHGRGYRFIRALKAGEGVRKQARPALLIGRAQELGLLQKILDKAAGAERQMVFITGQSGIGKTVLLNEFVRRLERRPGICAATGLVAQVKPETEPFSPILDAVGNMFETQDGQGLLSAFRECAPCWLIQFPTRVDPADSLRIHKDLAGATSQRMIREFADAVNLFCRDAMMVLGLDDLQRADHSTLDLLNYLASVTSPAKLLIIATVGEEADSGRVRSLIAPLKARGCCEEIALSGLTQQNVEEFLSVRYASSNLESALSGPLYKLSGGVPLFLISAAHYIEAQNWIFKTEHGWVLSAATVRLEELVPPTLNELIDQSLQRLTTEEQQILEAASIVGVEFTASLVAAALDAPLSEVEERLNQLVRHGGWLQVIGFAYTPDGETSPKLALIHELYREVLHFRQSAAERVQRHRRVAISLEKQLAQNPGESASVLALHFAAGKFCSKSIEYLRAAAKNGLRRYAGAEAAALLTEALKLTSGLTRSSRVKNELEILNDLGIAYFACGDFDHCSRAWHEAAIKAIRYGRVDVAIQAMSHLAFPVGWNDPTRLPSIADRVLAQVDKIDDPIKRAEVTINALGLRDVAGVWKAEDSCRGVAALAEIVQGGDLVQIASAQTIAARFRLRNAEYKEAISTFEESLPLVMQHDVMDVMRAEWGLSWALLHAGQWGRMQSVATSAAGHAAKNANSKVEALFTSLLAWLHVESGAYESAESLCRRAFELTGNAERGVGVAMLHIIMAMATRGQHNADISLDHIQRAFDTNPPETHLARLLIEINSLEAHLMNDKLDKVSVGARRVLQLLAGSPEKTWKAVALSVCAKVSKLTNQPARAQEYLKSALNLIESTDLPLAKWRVEAAAADVLSSECSDEKRRFSERSRESRRRLFDSLANQDPLRHFLEAKASA